MKLSIFSPTHNPQYIEDTYRSIVQQGYQNWEWIVAPNAKEGEPLPTLPEWLRNSKDSRIRVVPYHYQDKPMVGALKRFCCDQAVGDVFVELDHDDMLMPGILTKIAEAAKEGAGFIYSDEALFNATDNAKKAFGEMFGWESYDVQVYGQDLLATRNFPVSPRMLCEVHYAPDHIRCWSREAYYTAGGHDAELEVGDDHDLVCRTYLAGVEFKHTGGCGYLYRFHPDNTVKSHNKAIQVQQGKNRDKYLYEILEEWCHREGLLFLDLENPPEEIELEPAGAIEHNSVGVIKAYGHYLPKLENQNIPHFIEKVYDWLVPGGFFCARAPSTDGREAFAPHLSSLWNQHSFSYYTDRRWQLPGNRARFQAVRLGTTASDEERRKAKLLDVVADLCALKGQRQPGRVHI